MYFNDDKADTNIDEEFGEDFTSTAIKTINKYKFVFIGAVVLEILILIMIYYGSEKTINYLVLHGDDTVNIYRGTSYVETGYEAYNSKNVNLTEAVKVKSTLNASKVGEYEIQYKLGDIVKVRKVNVIQRPDNYTRIGLVKVNDDVDIKLKVGQPYVEPGYEVLSSDKSLTEKVRVTGTVDTSVKGSYTLTYSVVDLNNVTVNATRTIVVE